jgi:hypothetical protein
MVKAIDDIRRQANLVAYDYDPLMREAKAANTDLAAAHVIAEHIILNPGTRLNWDLFLKLYRKRRK